MNYARKSVKKGDLKAAELACRDASAIDPLNAKAFHLLAHIACSQNHLQNAGDYILEAVKRDDTNIEIYADCGAIMNMLGRAPEAEAACRHVINYSPGHADAWNNLCVALEHQRRLDEALDACNTALLLREGFVDALINKGSISVKSGNLIVGIEALSSAVELAPRNPVARVNLATALKHAREYDLALEHANMAIQIRIDHPEGYAVLGDSLAASGQFSKALEAYNSALFLEPNLIAVRLNKAAVLYKLDRLSDAASEYSSVLNDFGENADAMAGLGVISLAAGELGEAEKHFRRTVTIDPSHGEAWSALAGAPQSSLSREDMRALSTLANNGKAGIERQIAAHFALADTFDRRSDFPAAFHYYKAGNEIRRANKAAQDQRFNLALWEKNITEIILRNKSSSGKVTEKSLSNRPVFLVGMPRSGTTLIEQILASHPLVCGIGEAQSMIQGQSSYNAVPQVDVILKYMIDHAPKAERVIDKTPFHFLDIGLIRSIFPRAYIIHCRRDVISVGLSCYMQNFVDDHLWSCDLTEIGGYINGYNRLMNHWRELLGSSIIEVEYECLVKNPESQIRHLIHSIELDWNDSCLEFHETKRIVKSASNWGVRQPIYANALDRVKHYEKFLDPLIENLRFVE